MNYKKIYSDLIRSRLKNPPKENFEKHHILPRSLFPEKAKDKNNLVKLEYKAHYIAHLLLYRYYKSIGNKEATSKMAYALFKMCFGKNGLKISLNQYEKAKIVMINSQKGRKLSEETKRKISVSEKGKQYCLGKHWKLSFETKQKMSEARKGNQNSKGKHYNKNNNSMLGKHHSFETKNKISIARKGSHWFNDGIKNYFCKECPKGCTYGRLK